MTECVRQAAWYGLRVKNWVPDRKLCLWVDNDKDLQAERLRKLW